MRSKTVQRVLDKMDRDPWYIKFKRWFKVQIWIYKCLTRKYWDKEYQHYIFKKKQ